MVWSRCCECVWTNVFLCVCVDRPYTVSCVCHHLTVCTSLLPCLRSLKGHNPAIVTHVQARSLWSSAQQWNLQRHSLSKCQRKDKNKHIHAHNKARNRTCMWSCLFAWNVCVTFCSQEVVLRSYVNQVGHRHSAKVWEWHPHLNSGIKLFKISVFQTFWMPQSENIKAAIYFHKWRPI